ncbi:MAG: hypothetical protein FJ398_16620 [Verrucomicrobia bacterium]|nr:hypothetical protein [Verrucomicrobiota bacterium]
MDPARTSNQTRRGDPNETAARDGQIHVHRTRGAVTTVMLLELLSVQTKLPPESWKFHQHFLGFGSQHQHHRYPR